ncbi:alpha/beta fold hydrolase [Leifsonia aquatica]|uniref:alpha/beta fold hydrolase n=1 Tax=Leifsonia aquatica TaxID=144185 RepID=UPI000468316F|nr:alpha/beta hydrolase [Leifsonia aquatica]
MPHLRIAGVDVYEEVAGSGDPVLLLHGGFCSLESLRAQSDALVADHRVLAFERPGHGRSPDVEGEYSYERGLVEVVAYLDAHRLDRVDVVGYSDGAILGLMLALAQPERVRSLVAISANLDPSAFTHSDEAADAVMLQPLGLPAHAPDVADSDAAEPDAAGPEPDTDADAERMQYDRLSPDGPEHADIVLGKLFRLWTSEPRIDPATLAAVTARTLVMSGDRDTIRPDHSLLIASSIPGAQLAIVPGATHGLVAERPELIATLVRGFLDPAGADRSAR